MEAFLRSSSKRLCKGLPESGNIYEGEQVHIMHKSLTLTSAAAATSSTGQTVFILKHNYYTSRKRRRFKKYIPTLPSPLVVSSSSAVLLLSGRSYKTTRYEDADVCKCGVQGGISFTKEPLIER